MTPEEAVAHKAQEQFDEYEREIAALRAALVTRAVTLARALHATNAGGICPREDCDYHWQMAKAALAHIGEYAE